MLESNLFSYYGVDQVKQIDLSVAVKEDAETFLNKMEIKNKRNDITTISYFKKENGAYGRIKHVVKIERIYHNEFTKKETFSFFRDSYQDIIKDYADAIAFANDTNW